MDFEFFVDFLCVSVDFLQIFLGICMCVTGVVTFAVPVMAYAQAQAQKRNSHMVLILLHYLGFHNICLPSRDAMLSENIVKSGR